MSYLKKLFNLENKVVAVTGACGQLGKQICGAYRKAGSKVIALDVRPFKGRGSQRTYYYQLDISKKNDVFDCFSAAFNEFGAIDILVNNAGLAVFDPFEKRKEEEFDSVLSVNLKGTFFCIQAYVKLFRERKMKKGSIINIASFYGLVSPDPRIYTDCSRISSEVYGASKAGVIQMTKYFAAHLAASGIRVNCVSPGGIYNPRSPQGKDFIKKYSFRCPMKRMGCDSEMLGAIIYLSSDSASYTTGQNIVVDGGMTCW